MLVVDLVVVVVVVIISLSKQLFWQPSKQQRPNGSCGSLVGQSISFVPGDQQIGFLPETGQTLSPSASTWGQEFSCKAIETGKFGNRYSLIDRQMFRSSHFSFLVFCHFL